MTRRLVAEALGSAALLAMVVGSGIMGEQLAGGSVAVALLVNALATAAGLVVLIVGLGPISGAHFNPAVSLAQALGGRLSWRELPGYVLAQVGGAVVGVVAAHAMFGQALLQTSQHARTGRGLWWSEVVATAGLVLTLEAVSRARAAVVPYAVGLYILSAYFFTSSTSFANPAVTLARTLTDTFAGIRASDAPMFLVMQGLGAVGAVALTRWLWAARRAPVPARRSELALAPRESTSGW